MANDDLDDIFDLPDPDAREEGLDFEEEEEDVDENLSRWQQFRQSRRRKRERYEDEQEAINEYWYKDPNIEVKVPKADAEYAVLDQALWDNRFALENLKHAYCRSHSRRNRDVRDSYMHEIKRLVAAIESIKDVLASRGEPYHVSYRDREHPDWACRRHRLCVIATVLYGEHAPETIRLRAFRDQVLDRSRTGRILSSLYYRIVGPLGVMLLQHFPVLRKPARASIRRLASLVPLPATTQE